MLQIPTLAPLGSFQKLCFQNGGQGEQVKGADAGGNWQQDLGPHGAGASLALFRRVCKEDPLALLIPSPWKTESTALAAPVGEAVTKPWSCILIGLL